MTRIAVTGHRNLSGDATDLVDHAIRKALAPHGGQELTGLCCLGDGADQIFARAVLDLGGALEVVVPGNGFRDTLPARSHHRYDELLRAASAVHHIRPRDGTAPAMPVAAYMLTHAHLLFAVWDGEAPQGQGGTADVVAYARNHGVPVEVIWPAGTTRTG